MQALPDAAAAFEQARRAALDDAPPGVCVGVCARARACVCVRACMRRGVKAGEVGV